MCVRLTAVIEDNRIQQLRGGDGELLYVYNSDGGSTAGIHIDSAAYSQIIDNIIAVLAGGRSRRG